MCHSLPMPNTHIETALGHLSAVAETRAHLSELYDHTKRNLHDTTRNNIGAQIAEAHQSIGYGLKAAAVHAALANAVATEALIEATKGAS